MFMRVVADYDAAASDELSLRIGDRVRVWYCGPPKDWWQGEIESELGSKLGLFPSAFCERDDLFET